MMSAMPEAVSSMQDYKPNEFTWRGVPVRGILLDMDGTIADTKHAHGDAWAIWAQRHNIPVSREMYMRDYFGRSNTDVLPELFPHLAHDEQALRALGMEKEHDFLDLVLEGKIPPTAGLTEFIQRAYERGIGLAIASSAPRENVETISRVFGLQDKISVRLSMDDVKRAKPAPDLFLKSAELLGIEPAACLVIEDSKHGLDAGRSAGCRTIAVMTLHTEHELESYADLCVDDFNELLQLEEWRKL